MSFFRKGEKGSSLLVTPIVWTISIFVFIFFLVTAMNVIEPFAVYQKISETSLKYIFIMEEFGCLASSDKVNLQKELQQKGLDLTRLKITADEKVREYGEVVTLDIEYLYPFRYALFGGRGLEAKYSTSDICMRVCKKGVSKR